MNRRLQSQQFRKPKEGLKLQKLSDIPSKLLMERER